MELFDPGGASVAYRFLVYGGPTPAAPDLPSPISSGPAGRGASLHRRIVGLGRGPLPRGGARTLGRVGGLHRGGCHPAHRDGADAPQPPDHRGAGDARRARGHGVALVVDGPPGAAAAGAHRGDRGSDRGGRPLPPRGPDGSSDRGRPIGRGVERDARPDRGGHGRTPRLRGGVAPVPGGRVARAPHAAHVDPRLRGVVPPRRRRAPRGHRARHAQDRAGRGAHGRARRGSPLPGAGGRRQADPARTGGPGAARERCGARRAHARSRAGDRAGRAAHPDRAGRRGSPPSGAGEPVGQRVGAHPGGHAGLGGPAT